MYTLRAVMCGHFIVTTYSAPKVDVISFSGSLVPRPSLSLSFAITILVWEAGKKELVK